MVKPYYQMITVITYHHDEWFLCGAHYVRDVLLVWLFVCSDMIFIFIKLSMFNMSVCSIFITLPHLQLMQLSFQVSSGSENYLQLLS